MDMKVPDSKLEEILSNKDFVGKLLILKTKDEVKKLFLDNGMEINNEDVEQLGEQLRKLVPKLITGKLTDEQLKNLSAGDQGEGKTHVSNAPSGLTRAVGQGFAWPFKTFFYAVGAVVAGLPKGFYDGWNDTWYGYDI